jgi:glycosyltransferase involved in cell wall biosynthesis
MPRVSVIIPLYNKERYIARCLDSVLAQTFSDYEVIIVDDGSTDGSSAVVSRYASEKVRCVRQDNAGPGAARNRGVAESSGEFIAFLDADDEWHPQFLERLVGFLDRWPHVEIAGCQWLDLRTGIASVVPELIPRGAQEGTVAHYFRDAVPNPVLSTSSVVIRRQALDDVGAFNTSARLGEDLELWARIAARCPLGFVAEPLAYYHREAIGRACDTPALPPYPPVVRFLQEVISTIHLGNDEVADVREYCNYWLIHHANCLHARGAAREARRTLWRECRSTRRFRWLRLSTLALAFMPTGLRTWMRALKQRLTGSGRHWAHGEASRSV